MDSASFVYWYVSIFFIVFGAILIVRRESMLAFSCYFRNELRDPAHKLQLEAILERRRALEGGFGRPVVFCAIGFIFFGAMTLFRVLTPALSDALAYADCALVFAVAFSAIRNRGDRRAASLTPRSVERAIPVPAMVGALISSLLPLAVAPLPSLLIPALIVTATALVVCAAAWSIAGMAAVIVGDDADLELFVDDRMRRARANLALIFGYAISPTFLGIVAAQGVDDAVYVAALVSAMLLILVYAAWFMVAIRGFSIPLRRAQS